jgi:hypothetical protein
VLRILASSPEYFCEKLRAKLRVRDANDEDLLPEDERLWDHLTAPIDQSATLAAFIDNELANERRGQVTRLPVKAIESISLTFSSPALVPKAMLAELDTETVLQVIQNMLEFDDHFALVSAFEVCADRVQSGARFAELGDRLLDRLVKDFSWLESSCRVFASVFIIATARLALHEALRRGPVYWRRLAASSLASLVVRTCGVSTVNSETVLSWAIQLYGQEYMLSIYSDMAIEPQWRPEWLDTRFLVADALGRLHGDISVFRARPYPRAGNPASTRQSFWQMQIISGS